MLISEPLNFKRKQLIYQWYKAYRKANPENSIKTSFHLAKFSYERSLYGEMYFIPFIPKTPKPVINLA